MKRMIRALVAAAVLVSAMTCSAFAATTDYTEDKSTNAASYVGTVDYDASTGKYTAAYSDATAGNQYVLLVAEGTPDSYTITQDSILYIDQAAADVSVSFSGFIPKTITDSVVLLGGKFADGQSPKVLGALKMPYMLGDVNEDKVITAPDALLALRIATNNVTNATATQRKAADVNFDGNVAATDALLILRRATNHITEFPTP